MVYLMRLYWSADDYNRFNDPKKDDSSKLKAGWSTFLQTVIMCDRGEREKLQCAESTASAVWAAMKDVVDVLSAEYDWLCERTGQSSPIHSFESHMLTRERRYEMVRV